MQNHFDVNFLGRKCKADIEQINFTLNNNRPSLQNESQAARDAKLRGAEQAENRLGIAFIYLVFIIV